LSPVNQDIPPFNGFKEESFKFLADLSENNSLSWFTDNRERYDKFIVLPSKSFIVSIAPFFNQLEPKINTEPKFDKTMLRINKDARFTDGNPYRTYFLIHFRKFKKDSEFYLYINKNRIEYGLFINNSHDNELFFNKNLPGYKDELVDTFRKFELNGEFNFYEMKKEQELITQGFNIEENFDRMARTKFILLQKELSKDIEIIYSTDLLREIMKTFSQLYTIYCFCISHNPLALIKIFEEEMGIPK
jgi:uncharacterized protein (DUF2461 family)